MHASRRIKKKEEENGIIQGDRNLIKIECDMKIR